MFEIVTFTVVGITVYAVSDWILQKVEEKRGRKFEEYRSIIFFALFLLLVLLSFEVIKRVSPTEKQQPAGSVTTNSASPSAPSSPEAPRK
jgi:hypothetical protein